MSARDQMSTVAPQPDPYKIGLVYYEIALAVIMMGLGLSQWAIIVGLFSNVFDALSAEAKVATMYLAVADLVAAVGLWMRVPWGRVIFIGAVISEIALHTVLIATYGSNWPLVALYVFLLAIYAILAVFARRRPADAP
jgi:hypothetical protein